MDGDTLRILVADDHSLFRDGLVSLLEAAGHEVVGQVGEGSAAVEAALRLRPDVTLMDIAMPGTNGLEALRQIRAEWSEARVVMLTVSDDGADLFEAVEAGAGGYLLKSLKADKFIELLAGIERGEAAMTRQTTARLLADLSRAASRPHAPSENLTQREMEILNYMAQGFSNKAIAQATSLSENTVKYHVKNILQKLSVHNRTEAVACAIRAGLVHEARGS